MGSDWTRRDVLEGGLLTSGSLLAYTLLPGVAFAQSAQRPANAVPVSMRLNGRALDLQVEPRVSLLDLLRERLQLAGAKKGCNQGACGACTVHMNGERVLSCLTLAVQADGTDIVTIEGLADQAAAEGIAEDGLHPVQAAFIEHDGQQCGYCTPGQIMAGVACIREGNAGSEADIREFMSGNLCRCGAHNGIIAAIADARQRMGV